MLTFRENASVHSTTTKFNKICALRNDKYLCICTKHYSIFIIGAGFNCICNNFVQLLASISRILINLNTIIEDCRVRFSLLINTYFLTEFQARSKLPKKRRRVLPVEQPRPKRGEIAGGVICHRRVNAIKYHHQHNQSSGVNSPSESLLRTPYRVTFAINLTLLSVTAQDSYCPGDIQPSTRALILSPPQPAKPTVRNIILQVTIPHVYNFVKFVSQFQHFKYFLAEIITRSDYPRAKNNHWWYDRRIDQSIHHLKDNIFVEISYLLLINEFVVIYVMCTSMSRD